MMPMGTLNDVILRCLVRARLKKLAEARQDRDAAKATITKLLAEPAVHWVRKAELRVFTQEMEEALGKAGK